VHVLLIYIYYFLEHGQCCCGVGLDQSFVVGCLCEAIPEAFLGIILVAEWLPSKSDEGTSLSGMFLYNQYESFQQ
jgi:hypothetical protein